MDKEHNDKQAKKYAVLVSEYKREYIKAAIQKTLEHARIPENQNKFDRLTLFIEYLLNKGILEYREYFDLSDFLKKEENSGWRTLKPQNWQSKIEFLENLLIKLSQ